MKYVDLGIVIDSTLIISDLHIGYEESLQKRGVLVPRFQFSKLKERLSKLLNEVKPEIVVINGDLKHEFGKISDQEWSETLKIIDLITEKAKLILVKGNHDKIIGPIANKRDVEIRDYVLIDDVYICHGNVIPQNDDFKKAQIVIIGHAHPVYGIREGSKYEKYKCFVKTRFRNKTLYVLPSFSDITKGVDFISGDIISPFMLNLRSVEITISQDGKLYDFGKVNV